MLYGVEVQLVYFEQICGAEGPKNVTEAQIPEGWPQSGSISFQNYTMRYRERTPIVLNRLQVHIKAGEKIGIVGRTGSGKLQIYLFYATAPSSLFLACVCSMTCYQECLTWSVNDQT